MATRGDEAVHKIAKRARDDEETAQQGPGPAQPPRDSQRGRRSQINLAVLNQNQAARCLASHPIQGQERRGLVGLGRAKSKIPLRVTRRDELYGALAERAGPVEEHDGSLINAATTNHRCHLWVYPLRVEIIHARRVRLRRGTISSSSSLAVCSDSDCAFTGESYQPSPSAASSSAFCTTHAGFEA